jgi:hypothetical protein
MTLIKDFVHFMGKYSMTTSLEIPVKVAVKKCGLG